MKIWDFHIRFVWG